MADSRLHGVDVSVPVPDPTLLTTAALTREVNSLKELMETRLNAMDKAQSLFEENLGKVPSATDKAISHLKELQSGRFDQLEATLGMHTDGLITRIDGMDKAVKLLQDIADKFPNRIDEKIHSLRSVHDEKFSSIQKQFQERDVRTEQSSKDSKVAVDAALQAAKEAVGEQNKSSASAIAKSETATAKQIDQIMALIQTGSKAMDDKISDVKERLTRLEGSREGAGNADNSHRMQSNWAIGIMVTIVLAAITIALHYAGK